MPAGGAPLWERKILRSEDYLTICYALIDSRNGRMELVRAGHPYPLLSKTGAAAVDELKPAGPTVGMESPAQYETLTLELEAGDSVLFFTDGLTEAMGENLPSNEGAGRADMVRRRFGEAPWPDRFVEVVGRSLEDRALFLIHRANRRFLRGTEVLGEQSR